MVGGHEILVGFICEVDSSPFRCRNGATTFLEAPGIGGPGHSCGQISQASCAEGCRRDDA